MKNRRLQNVINEFKKNKTALAALIFIVLLIIVSLAIVFVNVDPNAIDVQNMLQGPSKDHWFGTDEVGRDYLTRVIYGGRVSLLVGVLAMVTSIVIGVCVGCIAGYFGGAVDNILMRAVDIFSAIPWIIMVTVVSLLFKRGLFSIVFVIGIFSWMEIARLVRTEALSLKERDYIKYAGFIGINPFKIMFKHVIPAVFPTIITAATSSIANAIMTESAMSFLGIGVQQPMSSWGSLLQTAQSTLSKAPYMAVLPGILIVLTVCSFNKLGDVLHIFVEPKITAGESNE